MPFATVIWKSPSSRHKLLLWKPANVNLNRVLSTSYRAFGPFCKEMQGKKTMPSQTTDKTRLAITWILRILLGVTFLGIGIEKLTGTMGTIPFFDAIGWGQWFRYASGALDMVGALLILIPRWTLLGALIITCTVGLGTILCFTKALYNPIFPLVMTLLAATLVWLTWKTKAARVSGLKRIDY